MSKLRKTVVSLFSTRQDMPHDDLGCIEFSHTTFRKKPPQMIRVEELEDELRKYPDEELYISRYVYANELPYFGPVASPFYMDFDAEGNLRESLIDLQKTISYLHGEYGIPFEAFRIWFTGFKGFCLEVDHRVFGAKPNNHLPEIWEEFARSIKERAKLKHVDLSVYDRRRLWRVENTINAKSGKYKIPLTYLEATNGHLLDDLLKLAEHPRTIEKTSGLIDPIPALQALYAQAAERIQAACSEPDRFWRRTSEDIPTEFNEQLIPYCVKKRIEEGITEGTFGREPTAMYVAIALKLCGATREQAEVKVREFAKHCTPEFTDEDQIQHALETAFTKNYAVGHSTECFKDICRESCKTKCPLTVPPASAEDLRVPGLKSLDGAGGFTEDFVYEAIPSVDENGFEVWYLVVCDGKTASLIPMCETRKDKAGNIIGRPPFKQVAICEKPYRLQNFPGFSIPTLWSANAAADFIDDPKTAPSPATVFARVEAAIRYFSDMDDGSDLVNARYALLTCHTIATYFYDVFSMFPYAAFLGPTGSGKSRTMSAVLYQSYHGYLIGPPTPSVIFRVTQALKPALGMDNVERIYDAATGTDEESKKIVELLDVGAYKGATVLRVEGSSERGDRFLKKWDAFGPKFFTSVKGLTPSLLSRTLPHYMIKTMRPEYGNRGSELAPIKRKAHDPKPEELTLNRDDLYKLRMAMLRDIQAYAETLKGEDFGIMSREWEQWLPIFTIAYFFCPERVTSLKKLALQMIQSQAGEMLHEDRTVLLQLLLDRYDPTNEFLELKVLATEYTACLDLPFGKRRTPKEVSKELSQLGFTEKKHRERGNVVRITGHILQRQAQAVGLDTSRLRLNVLKQTDSVYPQPKTQVLEGSEQTAKRPALVPTG